MLKATKLEARTEFVTTEKDSEPMGAKAALGCDINLGKQKFEFDKTEISVDTR